ncbi:O-antigen ligase [Actinopolymorpha singaporensis]|uniref:O-antigen ligase n=1 Tax=Actinopolymorpha singaporensis TaxID=117157 RepID=A0A1H1RMP2_9ACTN|nr:O-antigen ligase [Actinopolymorpha singaporensis]
MSRVLSSLLVAPLTGHRSRSERSPAGLGRVGRVGQALVSRIDPATVLSVFVAVLMLLPSRYVVGPLGAAGTPAGLMAVACMLWYLSALITPHTTPVRGRQPLRTVVVFFVGSVLASYAAMQTEPRPALEINGADRGLILAAGWAGIALLAADGISRLERLEVLRRRLVTGGSIVAALGLVQFFSGIDIAGYLAVPGLTANSDSSSVLRRDEFNRPMATATHPIELGVVLTMLLPLALHGLLHARPGTVWRHRIQVFLLLATIPMTVSRSAILGVLVAAVVMVPVWSGKIRAVVLIVLGCGTVAMQAVVPGLMGTIRNLVTSIGSDSSTTARTDDYGAVLAAVTHRPWFGQGLGTYLPMTYRILDNQYLGSVVETGLVGLAALLALFAAGWLLARGARRASSNPEVRHLAQCFAATMAVAGFSFGTFDALSFPMVTNLTFLMLGCCAALWRLARENPTAGLSETTAAVPEPRFAEALGSLPRTPIQPRPEPLVEPRYWRETEPETEPEGVSEEPQRTHRATSRDRGHPAQWRRQATSRQRPGRHRKS